MLRIAILLNKNGGRRPPMPSPASAGESHMEFFDSFPIQKDPVGFEKFPLKPSAILKLRRLGFGKSYAIALPARGRGAEPSSLRGDAGCTQHRAPDMDPGGRSPISCINIRIVPQALARRRPIWYPANAAFDRHT